MRCAGHVSRHRNWRNEAPARRGQRRRPPFAAFRRLDMDANRGAAVSGSRSKRPAESWPPKFPSRRSASALAVPSMAARESSQQVTRLPAGTTSTWSNGAKRRSACRRIWATIAIWPPWPRRLWGRQGQRERVLRDRGNGGRRGAGRKGRTLRIGIGRPLRKSAICGRGISAIEVGQTVEAVASGRGIEAMMRHKLPRSSTPGDEKSAAPQ